MENINKKKLAIIGIGRWGRNLLKEFTLQSEIVKICYKGGVDTQKFLDENYPTIGSTTDYKEILTDNSVEAVVIATPTQTHFAIANQALDAKKHIFLEKPGGTSSQDLEKLNKKAKDNNLVLAIGYEFPHHPALKKIKEIISDEPIQSIHFQWLKWGTFETHAVPHLLSHDISIMESLINLSDIKILNYLAQKVISDSDIIDVTFKAGGTILTSHINRASVVKHKSVTVVTNNHQLIWSNDKLYSINKESLNYEEVSIPATSAVASEIADFIDSISNKKESLINGESATEIFKVIEKIKL